MTSVLLVGAGAVGAAAGGELVRTPGIDEVLLAARRPKPVVGLAAMLGRTARASSFCAGDPLPDGVSVVATAVPSEVDAAVASAAVDAGVPFVSSSDAANTVDGLFALDGAATERGVPLVAGCGLAPGLADVLAAPRRECARPGRRGARRPGRDRRPRVADRGRGARCANPRSNGATASGTPSASTVRS